VRVKKREELRKYLLKEGIQTLIHYPIPPHKQEAYKEFKNLSFPVTERIHDEILSLPTHSLLSDNKLEKIVDTINRF
jgi:dTDP-4-amino-4,6-dideoxygalactose transaminase